MGVRVQIHALPLNGCVQDKSLPLHTSVSSLKVEVMGSISPITLLWSGASHQPPCTTQNTVFPNLYQFSLEGYADRRITTGSYEIGHWSRSSDTCEFSGDCGGRGRRPQVSLIHMESFSQPGLQRQMLSQTQNLTGAGWAHLLKTVSQYEKAFFWENAVSWIQCGWIRDEMAQWNLSLIIVCIGSFSENLT